MERSPYHQKIRRICLTITVLELILLAGICSILLNGFGVFGERKILFIRPGTDTLLEAVMIALVAICTLFFGLNYLGWLGLSRMNISLCRNWIQYSQALSWLWILSGTLSVVIMCKHLDSVKSFWIELSIYILIQICLKLIGIYMIRKFVTYLRNSNTRHYNARSLLRPEIFVHD